MTRKIIPKIFADQINKHCTEFEYFWATGLIKETLPLWKIADNRALLGEDALSILSYYEQE